MIIKIQQVNKDTISAFLRKDENDPRPLFGLIGTGLFEFDAVKALAILLGETLQNLENQVDAGRCVMVVDETKRALEDRVTQVRYAADRAEFDRPTVSPSHSNARLRRHFLDLEQGYAKGFVDGKAEGEKRFLKHVVDAAQASQNNEATRLLDLAQLTNRVIDQVERILESRASSREARAMALETIKMSRAK